MKHIVLYGTLALFVVGFIAPLHVHALPSSASFALTGNYDETVEMLFSVPKASPGNSEAEPCQELSFTVVASEPTGDMPPIETPVVLNAGGFQRVELELGLLGSDTVDAIVELTNFQSKGLCILRPSLLRFRGPEGETRSTTTHLVEAVLLYHCYYTPTQVGCNPD